MMKAVTINSNSA